MEKFIRRLEINLLTTQKRKHSLSEQRTTSRSWFQFFPVHCKQSTLKSRSWQVHCGITKQVGWRKHILLSDALTLSQGDCVLWLFPLKCVISMGVLRPPSTRWGRSWRFIILGVCFCHFFNPDLSILCQSHKTSVILCWGIRCRLSSWTRSCWVDLLVALLCLWQRIIHPHHTDLGQALEYWHGCPEGGGGYGIGIFK